MKSLVGTIKLCPLYWQQFTYFFSCKIYKYGLTCKKRGTLYTWLTLPRSGLAVLWCHLNPFSSGVVVHIIYFSLVLKTYCILWFKKHEKWENTTQSKEFDFIGSTLPGVYIDVRLLVWLYITVLVCILMFVLSNSLCVT